MINWNEKKLGFGLMRLPKDENGVIDIEATAAMAEEFFKNGYTYLDTAYVYAGSEEAFKEAIFKRQPRERYTVASKMAAWVFDETHDPESTFNEQLERTGLDYFDFYLLHSLQGSRVELYEKNGCWDFCKKMLAEGKIKHFGFSYHGTPEVLDMLLTQHPETEFVQLQLNYVDWENEAICCSGNYEVCRRHNTPIIVMEPVKGGMLASLKPELEAKFKALDAGKSVSSYAMRYVGELPGVTVVLSGMSNMEQMQDNIATFNDLQPLSEKERETVEEVKKGILEADTVQCTSCRYCCEGCPQNINIPDLFKALNLVITFGDHQRPHLYYDALIAEGSGRASACIGCGQCEEVCPQHINIIENLAKTSKWLD